MVRGLIPLRAVGAAFLAAVASGILVGLASRLAMKVSALLSPEELIRVTENGNVVGDLTVEGTLALVIFAGIGPAMFAAVLYAATRPWLARFGAASGVIFGLLLLALAGAAVLQPTNGDFRRFGPPLVNVLMFGGLFVLTGMLIVGLTARSERLPERALRVAGAIGLAPLALAALSIVIGAAESVIDPTSDEGGTVFRLTLVLVVIALVLRWRSQTRSAWGLALIGPLIPGVFAAARSIRFIVGG